MENLLKENSKPQEIYSLILKSSDGQTFALDVKAAERSGYLIKAMRNNPGENEFYINEIDGKLLKKIVEFLSYYKDKEPLEIPRPLPNTHIENMMDEFSYNFINSFPLSESVEFLNAVENLEINSLVKLMCAKIAAKMMDAPIEEVRKIFGIESDMTEEERNKFAKYKLY